MSGGRVAKNIIDYKEKSVLNLQSVHRYCKIHQYKTVKNMGWEVLVGPETWTMHSSLKIQHVAVSLNVEEDKFDEFVAKYYLTFLKAGG